MQGLRKIMKLSAAVLCAAAISAAVPAPAMCGDGDGGHFGRGYGYGPGANGYGPNGYGGGWASPYFNFNYYAGGGPGNDSYGNGGPRQPAPAGTYCSTPQRRCALSAPASVGMTCGCANQSGTVWGLVK